MRTCLLTDDSFYEAIDRGSEVNTAAGGGAAEDAGMTPEEREAQQEEWRKELVKVRLGELELSSSRRLALFVSCSTSRTETIS